MEQGDKEMGDLTTMEETYVRKEITKDDSVLLLPRNNFVMIEMQMRMRRCDENKTVDVDVDENGLLLRRRI